MILHPIYFFKAVEFRKHGSKRCSGGEAHYADDLNNLSYIEPRGEQSTILSKIHNSLLFFLLLVFLPTISYFFEDVQAAGSQSSLRSPLLNKRMG